MFWILAVCIIILLPFVVLVWKTIEDYKWENKRRAEWPEQYEQYVNDLNNIGSVFESPVKTEWVPRIEGFYCSDGTWSWDAYGEIADGYGFESVSVAINYIEEQYK